MSTIRRTGVGNNVLFAIIGALIVAVLGLGYYAYEQSQNSADVEIKLEVPKITAE
jgi:hypothetical protein